MIRLFLFGLFLILGLVATIVSLYLVFAIIRWLKRLFSASTEFVNKQHQDWQNKQAEKHIPDYLRQANQLLTKTQQHAEQLTPKWQLLLSPVLDGSQYLLQVGMAKPEQTQSARSFFTVTLKALEGFTETLVDMNGVMQDSEEEKARQNIEVFMTDIYKYRTKIESKKRFDFHVMMEVIKQRLKK